ncbi:MAG: hypothetical protein FK734_12505 [Asgard group archaeon]|nr:hypothetical protein [Asgard group archaeon]
MGIQEIRSYPFKRWTWKTVGWATLCFVVIGILTFFFSFAFDVYLFDNKMGYYYSYFALLFYTLILYLFYEKFGVNWFGLFAFGLNGLIGIPVEYYFEWQMNQSLKSPWFAVAWGAIYIMYGLAADLIYWAFKMQKNNLLTVTISSVIFSLLFILFSFLALKTFYVPVEPSDGAIGYMTYWYFMIPFALIEGVIGAYAGMQIAHSIKPQEKSN